MDGDKIGGGFIGRFVSAGKLCDTAEIDSTAVIEDRCVDGDAIVGGLGGTFRLPSCLATMPSKIEPREVPL